MLLSITKASSAASNTNHKSSIVTIIVVNDHCCQASPLSNVIGLNNHRQSPSIVSHHRQSLSSSTITNVVIIKHMS